MRECYACGSSDTRVKKGKYPDWYINPPTSLVLCSKCYPTLIYKERKNELWRKRYHKNPEFFIMKNKKYIQEHPEVRDKFNQRHLNFKGKILVLKSPPRKGQCSKCKRRIRIDGIKRTAMHHAEGYFEEDPLKGTVELCNKCHKRAHKKMKLMNSGLS